MKFTFTNFIVNCYSCNQVVSCIELLINQLNMLKDDHLSGKQISEQNFIWNVKENDRLKERRASTTTNELSAKISVFSDCHFVSVHFDASMSLAWQ